MISGFAIGISLASLIIAVGALGVAAWALADVIAFKRSTHQVQFVSAETEAEEAKHDKLLNKVLSDSEFKAMQAEYGNERQVDQ